MHLLDQIGIWGLDRGYFVIKTIHGPLQTQNLKFSLQMDLVRKA